LWGWSDFYDYIYFLNIRTQIVWSDRGVLRFYFEGRPVSGVRCPLQLDAIVFSKQPAAEHCGVFLSSPVSRLSLSFSLSRFPRQLFSLFFKKEE